MQGWIRDHRKELESDIWMMPPLYHRVWQYLKYDVNHADRTIPNSKGEKLLVKKGQTVTSYQIIAEAVAWYEHGTKRVPNKKTIKAILDWLEMQEMITKNSNAKGTVITLCNYGVYQGAEDDEGNAGVTLGKRSLDTNNNDKNDKNDISTNTPSSEVVSQDPKPEPTPKFADNSPEVQLSEKLQQHILDNNPKARTPKDLQKWAGEFDKMIRIDGRSIDEIKAVIEFSQSDSFWKSNILSAGKLREKFDQLYLKAKTRASPVVAKNGVTSDYIRRQLAMAQAADEMRKGGSP